MHGDHDHHKAHSDDNHHDDGHGHDDYANDTDADDPVPSMPRNSPPSQVTTDSSGSRSYKTLKKIYKHAKPITLEYSRLCLLGVEEARHG